MPCTTFSSEGKPMLWWLYQVLLSLDTSNTDAIAIQAM